MLESRYTVTLPCCAAHTSALITVKHEIHAVVKVGGLLPALLCAVLCCAAPSHSYVLCCAVLCCAVISVKHEHHATM
jgi:hypothetical protein